MENRSKCRRLLNILASLRNLLPFPTYVTAKTKNVQGQFFTGPIFGLVWFLLRFFFCSLHRHRPFFFPQRCNSITGGSFYFWATNSTFCTANPRNSPSCSVSRPQVSNSSFCFLYILTRTNLKRLNLQPLNSWLLLNICKLKLLLSRWKKIIFVRTLKYFT